MHVMKTLPTVLAILLSYTATSQDQLFKMYTDSTALVQDANAVVKEFTTRVNAIAPVFDNPPQAILNTQVYLISYSPKANKINLPIWEQVIPPQKQFFIELSGGEDKGKEMFGLFFNGFYLPHELGHALQKAADKMTDDLYQNEYFANTVAMLYWRKTDHDNELRDCYEFAKKMMGQLPNPVPEGEDPVSYFNNNYEALGSDPYKYGYFQFAQFVEIYENPSLPSFDDFIKAFVSP